MLLLVCGEDQNCELSKLYRTAWKACIAALGHPLAHMLPFFMSLPLPIVQRYDKLTKKLRNVLLQKIKCRNSPPWSVLSVIQDEMCEEDQLEVAMEFMFTGASSVTSSLIWLVWHIACNKDLQESVRSEALENLKAQREGSNDDLKKQWLSIESASTCTVLEAALRETLRLYSPIHIGRLSLQSFHVLDSKGNKVLIRPGTDIMSNMWFIQRNEGRLIPHRLTLVEH